MTNAIETLDKARQEVAILQARAERAEADNKYLRDQATRPRERALYVRRDGSVEWADPYCGPDGRAMKVVRRARMLSVRVDMIDTFPPPYDERFHLVAQCERTLVYVEV